MKKQIQIWLFVAISAFVLANCKKSEQLEPTAGKPRAANVKSSLSTMQDLFFAGSIDRQNKMQQASAGKETTRTAYPYKEVEGAKVFRYQIIENNANGITTARSYLVSSNRLTPNFNLYSLNLANKVNAFLNNQLQTVDGVSSELEFKKDKGNLVDADIPTANLLPECNPANPQTVCIDWYLTLYDSVTGEILGEFYLYTDCYDPCAGGGGGGGELPGEEEEFDLEAEALLIAEMLATASEEQSQSMSFSSATMTELSFQWEVVRNQGNRWRVISNEIAHGYNSQSTGAVLYDIEHVGSSITGHTTIARQRKHPPYIPGTPPLVIITWSEIDHAKRINPDYRSGIASVTGALKNYGITFEHVANSVTIRMN